MEAKKGNIKQEVFQEKPAANRRLYLNKKIKIFHPKTSQCIVYNDMV